MRSSQVEIDQAICEEIRRNFRTNCLIMGDFNLRGYEDREGGDKHECQPFRKVFEEELFMHQYVNEPTRQRSILDLVFADNNELVNELTVCEGLGNSDHNMIQFCITSDVGPKDNLLKVPNFNRADFNRMRNELSEVNWNNELAELNACQAWSTFKVILDRIQCRHIPRKHKRNRKRDSPPWLTPEVRAAIQIKKDAFRSMKESLLESKKIIYQISRNQVKKRLGQSKGQRSLIWQGIVMLIVKSFSVFIK